MNKDRFKFRIYNSKIKMYYSDGYYINGNEYMDSYYEDVYDLPDYMIVEQCTGLKDNIGSLIYEGDILRTYDEDWVIVEWLDCGFKALIDDTYYDLDDIVDKYTQVISNIHKQAEQKDNK